MRVLKKRSWVASHWSWQWPVERTKADPLKTAQEVAEELNIEHFTVVWHLKLIGKVKKLSKWVPHELTENRKNDRFGVLSSLTLCSSETFLRLWHATKSGFYTTLGNEQLSVWTEKKLQSTSQSQTCTKKRSWSLMAWSTTAFWIPAQPLYLGSVLSKSRRFTQNCNVCRRHWSTEWAQFSTTVLDHMSHNKCFKSWMNWSVKSCLLHLTSRQLTTTCSASQQLLQGRCFHKQQEAENAF